MIMSDFSCGERDEIYDLKLDSEEQVYQAKILTTLTFLLPTEMSGNKKAMPTN